MQNGRGVAIAGTQKGVFLLKSYAKRERSELEGPHFRGNGVYAAVYDDRAGRLACGRGSTVPIGVRRFVPVITLAPAGPIRQPINHINGGSGGFNHSGVGGGAACQPTYPVDSTDGY